MKTGYARFSKGNSRRLGWSPRPFFHRFRGRRHLRGSNAVSAHAKQGAGNVGHDLRRCGIHCYELCRTTAHSRGEITLVFAALAERGSRARFVRWLTDRFGSPTHYKPVQLQYSGGLTIMNANSNRSEARDMRGCSNRRDNRCSGWFYCKTVTWINRHFERILF
jgi:hypothetical protein